MSSFPLLFDLGTRTHFLKFIEREFPAMLPRFERLYVKKYAPDAYRKEVQAMVRVLQERYGLPARDGQDGEERREERSDGQSEEKRQDGRGQEGAEAGPEQVGFAW